MRWDGYQWIPETVARDYPATQRILSGAEGDGVMRPTAPPAPKKPGWHRRTT